MNETLAKKHDQELKEVIIECALELNSLLITTPVEQLKHAMYTLLQKYVPFDSGMWIEGRPKNEKHSHLLGDRLDSAQAYGHSVMYFNQPKERLANYSTNVKNDPLFAAIVQNQGVAIRLDSLISREELEQSSIYKDHCVPYKVQHAMSIAIPNTLSGVFSFLSIFRATRGDYFSTADQQLHQLLAPLLVSAYFTGLYLATNASVLSLADTKAEEMAIVDDYGYIYAQSNGWREWLKAVKGDVNRVRLTQSFMKKVRKGDGCLNGYQLKAKLLDNDLYLCILKPIPQYALLLSKRQIQVAHLYAQGKYRKEIAEMLGISDGTVRNHLVAIFEKLGVENKVELVLALQTDSA